jgi:hypothetical protein
MRSPSGCKCLHCKEFFVPQGNKRLTQRYCLKAPCRQASKAAAQAKWLNKESNRGYFRGPENVERVRQWRRRNPDKIRPRKSTLPVDHACAQKTRSQKVLQDPATTEVAQNQRDTDHEQRMSRGEKGDLEGIYDTTAANGAVLQDLAGMQLPLCVGLISLLAGDVLQDPIDVLLRQLVDRGKRVLGNPVQTGRFAASDALNLNNDL